MGVLHKNFACVLTGLLVPYMTLLSPNWLSIGGIGPSWAVFWLLPWALIDGKYSGAIAGLCLGLILDGISLEGATHVPVLMLLGWGWGVLGRREMQVNRFFKIALLAWLGSVLLGISLWIQTIFIQMSIPKEYLRIWAVNTILSEAIITSLLAPLICYFLVYFWKKQKLHI